MKQVLAFLSALLVLNIAVAQQGYSISNLSLPPELAWYDNQFSGLYIQKGNLFLLSESRLQDRAEAKLYALSLTDLDRKIADTSYSLPYRKYHLYGLENLRTKMLKAGQDYEGLEAMVMENNVVYFSVETATPSAYCYLVKGQLTDTTVLMDTAYLVPVAKPVTANGAHIYNAGFEAMAAKNKALLCFFEYNYFNRDNYVYEVSNHRSVSGNSISRLAIAPLPFRITDITPVGKNRYTAVNYFFKGGGDDTVYRMPVRDTANNRLIRKGDDYQNYCRLITLQVKGKHITWKPLMELPVAYMSYNWEGIAAYKGGYFLMNDKYTPARPYISTLLYVKEN